MMFWSKGMEVSTGPVVTPGPRVEQWRGRSRPDAAGMKHPEAQRNLPEHRRDRAFLITIGDGVEMFVVETPPCPRR